MNAYAEIAKLIGLVIGGGLFAAIATVAVARISAKKDREIKAVDGEIILRGKIVDDRSSWEERILTQVKGLDERIEKQAKDLDEERQKRRDLETALHQSDMKQAEMQRQIELLQAENKEAQAQIVKLINENFERKQDCEEQIRLLHDELVETRKERDEYRARLQAITLTKNIGSLEEATLAKDTNQRVRKVEKAVDGGGSSEPKK